MDALMKLVKRVGSVAKPSVPDSKRRRGGSFSNPVTVRNAAGWCVSLLTLMSASFASNHANAQVPPPDNEKWCITGISVPGPLPQPNCFHSLFQAEAVLRAAVPDVGHLLELSPVELGNLRPQRVYTVPRQPPASYDATGYGPSGGDDASYCPNSYVLIAGSKLCLSEAELIAAQRQYVVQYEAIRNPNCQVQNFRVVGVYDEPYSRLEGNWFASYYSGPSSRQQLYDLACPALLYAGLSLPLHRVTKFTCPAGMESIARYRVILDTSFHPNICASGAGGTISKVKFTQVNSCGIGNPCHPATGDKSRTETDFTFAGRSFTRHYHSKREIGFAESTMGLGWTHNFTARAYPNSAMYVSPEGYYHPMAFAGNDANGRETYIVNGVNSVRIYKNADNSWTQRMPDGEIYTFNANGLMTGMLDTKNPLRNVQFTYQTTPFPPRLTQAIDAVGRVLQFQYGANNLLTGVTLPDGHQINYGYDSEDRLVTVDQGNGQVRTYHYAEATLAPNGDKGLLTGITDENGRRYASFSYDTYGRVKTSELHGPSGPVERTVVRYTGTNAAEVDTADGRTRQFTYSANTLRKPLSTTDAAGTVSNTYDSAGRELTRTDARGTRTEFTHTDGRLIRQIEAANTTTGVKRTTETDWDAALNLPTERRVLDAASVLVSKENYTYDTNGRVLTRVVTAPKNDGSGTNEIRTWTYTYNALGQVLTAKDPDNRTTTTVYFAATDTAVPPKYTKGDVQTITNAANHVVTMNEYDKNGRLLKMTDANGLITTMAYHPRGWMTSRAVSNGTTTETTFYVYDNVGQLTRVVLPDQSNLFYAYDDAHRLVGMSDQQSGASVQANGSLRIQLANLSGNKMIYTLDNMGNRVKEQHYDPAGTLQKQKQRAIDALNRLKQDIGGSAYASAAPSGAPVLDASVTGAPANASISQYGYDNNGNLTSTTDPLGRVTTNQYDALNRLTQVIDPQNGATKPTIYTYDAQNNLTQVTDPQGLQTKYTYNGHGNLIKQESPDTGTTQTKVNAMGNVVAKIDSMNRCTTTAYDSLHRPTTIKFYAASNASTNTQALCFGTIAGTVAVEETHTYTYDSITASLGGPGGKGRISRIADASGTTDFTYDAFGRVTSKTYTLSSNTTQNGGATNLKKAVTYSYNAVGQLQWMLTPSAQLVNYFYGAPSSANPGKLIKIQVNGIDVIREADYKPFGPNWGWDWGNSCDTSNPSTCTTATTPRINQHLRQFDLDYRPTTIASDPEGYSRNLAWDRANRIASINVPSGITAPGIANSQSLNQAFAYDLLDRLTNFNAGINGATTAAAGMALLPNETFAYDGIGNRKSRTTQAPGTSSTQSTNFAHGSTPSNANTHWLIQATGQNPNTWSYDTSGNTLYESNAQMWGGYGSTAGAPASLSYTLTSTGVQARALAYAYDAKNRLSKVSIAPANSTQTNTQTSADTVTYRINALGQRIQKIGAGIFAPNASPTAPFAVTLSNPPTATQLQSLNAQTTAFYANSRFMYDEQGRMIGEYAKDGKLIQEIVWFNDVPVAILKPKGANVLQPTSGTATTGNQGANNSGANGNTAAQPATAQPAATARPTVELFYVHPDHLGTPRVITAAQALTSTQATTPNSPINITPAQTINKAVWRWDSDPFGSSLGNSAPNENPNALNQIVGSTTLPYFTQFDLAFPGQKRDRETGKHQNHFRDYDPFGGRYTTSDPIGLGAGINTFGYVDQTPIRKIDPTGRIAIVVPIVIDACITVAPHIGIGIGLGIIMSTPGSTDQSRADECGDEKKCRKKDPCKGLRDMLIEHQRKLLEYMNNPLAYDNKGFLCRAKECGNMELYNKIIDTRIASLMGQIENFKKQLKECEEKNGM
jgi:RHS repeat-associated protein